MRILGVFCFVLCIHCVFGEGDDADYGPRVYADISDSAEEGAVSFDGTYMLLGLALACPRFAASIEDEHSSTKNNMTLPEICVGMGYAKILSEKFLVSVEPTLGISTKGKKEGQWSDLNAGFEKQRGAFHAGDRKGTLGKDSFSMSVDLKCGYLFPAYESMVFLKFGVSNMTGSYRYYNNGTNVTEVGIKSYIPTLGLGYNRKFNTKWGAILEVNISLKKANKARHDEVYHRTEISRRNARAMATFSI